MTMTDFYEDPEWFDFRWEEESGCEEDAVQDVQNLTEYLAKDGENLVVQSIILRNKQ